MYNSSSYLSISIMTWALALFLFVYFNHDLNNEYFYLFISAYNKSTAVPSEYFPEAAHKSRVISGSYSHYCVPLSDANSCTTYTIKPHNITKFIPFFWRNMFFSNKHKYNLNGVSLDRLHLDKSKLSNRLHLDKSKLFI